MYFLATIPQRISVCWVKVGKIGNGKFEYRRTKRLFISDSVTKHNVDKVLKPSQVITDGVRCASVNRKPRFCRNKQLNTQINQIFCCISKVQFLQMSSNVLASNHLHPPSPDKGHPNKGLFDSDCLKVT